MKMSRLLVSLALLLLVSIVPIQRAEGQCRVNEGVKLTACDADEGDWFGRSVSIHGDVAVIGAPGDDHGGDLSGSAYIFRFNGSTWVEEQKLIASDGAASDGFGHTLAISGDVAVVGSPQDINVESGTGSAYVFRFNEIEWVEEQKLTAPDGAPSDFFGISVSISGNVTLIGSVFDDDMGFNSGSAYVFRFKGGTWVNDQKLTAPDGADSDRFGGSVSVSGDVAFVGAYLDDDACPEDPDCDSGSVYMYRFDGSTWVVEQKLTVSDAAAGDHFGGSVSLGGDVAIVGASLDNDAGDDSGSAYVFRFDGSSWVEEQKLTASDAAESDWFGLSVSIGGNVAAVGAYHDDDAGGESGSAYLYRYDGSMWVEEQKLTSTDAAAGDLFGRSVSVSGHVAFFGAYRNDDACPEDPDCNSGSAYVFGINPVPSTPACGTIDARQPSAPDGSDPAGWDSIALTFDEPPGEMNAEDFAVVVSPPGDAPTVTDVTVDGNTATVHFDDFIPTEAWTTITHWPTGAVTRIGYLPADVNNDKLSNANDVLFLIDVLNGVVETAPPAYQTDADRSGATNANDVLRVIDLLNGAATYDEYLGAELPA
ncbi:MAG: hypothetical protein IID36_02735 [Planctomycetes bacterium]|nr:hypothetical protein [Planctomycetota bacterium]